MAAPVLVTAGVEQAGASAASAALTAPTRNVSDGLAVMLWTESLVATPTTPTGWELWCSGEKTNFKVRWYKRIADGTATDNFESTWAAATFRFSAMRRITGNSTNLAKWIVGTVNTGTVAAVTHLGVTTVSAENLLLGLFNTSISVTESSVTAGWTKSNLTSWQLYWKERAAAGAEANLVVTNTGASNWVSFMGAIPPKLVAPPFAPRTARNTLLRM